MYAQHTKYLIQKHFYYEEKLKYVYLDTTWYKQYINFVMYLTVLNFMLILFNGF